MIRTTILGISEGELMKMFSFRVYLYLAGFSAVGLFLYLSMHFLIIYLRPVIQGIAA